MKNIFESNKFEIKKSAAKKVVILEKLEKMSDENLAHVSNMQTIWPFIKSTNSLLPSIPPREVRELINVVQIRRKRKFCDDDDSAEYQPKKRAAIKTQHDVECLRKEVDDLKQKLAAAQKKLADMERNDTQSDEESK